MDQFANTENTQAKANLYESEERFRWFSEATFEGIVVSENGKVVDANRKLLELLGYENRLDEALGRSVLDFVAPEYRQQVQKYIRNGYNKAYKVRVLRIDGSSLPVEVLGKEISYQGRIVRMAAIRDISDREEAEENMRRRADELSALYKVSLDITASRDLPVLLQTIVERAVMLLNGTSGGLYLNEPDQEEVRCVVSYNTAFDYTGTVLKYGEGAAGVVAQTGKPLIIDDYRKWKGRASAFDENQPFTAVLSAPLIWQGKVSGVIHVLHDVETRCFNQNDLELLTLFANQAAIAIENARLYAAERQRVNELDALRATITDISSELELPNLLQAILERAATLLDAAGGDLGLFDEASQEILIVVSHNMGKDYAATRMALGEGAMGTVAETLQPLVIDDYNQWEGRSPQYSAGPYHAVMAAPLLIGGRLVGVIGIAHNDPVRKFTRSDLNLLNLFAQQAAIAVENARLFSEVQRLAITDPLTGLFNRRYFFEVAEQEFERFRRYQCPLSIIMVDVDDFKCINDSYGHCVGDEVLRALAEHCGKFLREVDIVSRYGGEEYAILLPETDLQGACAAAERIRDAVNSSPLVIKDKSIPVTISLGVAEVSEGTPDLTSLLDQADVAMYTAKQAGRNRVERYIIH